MNKKNILRAWDKIFGSAKSSQLLEKYFFISEYKILTFKNRMELESEVNSFLKRGWTLQGGVSTSNNLHETTFSQAIIYLIEEP